MRYSEGALAKSSVGFDIPCTERRSAHPMRFFYAQVLWWVNQRLERAPFLSTGYVNSDSPAALLFDINGGSFQNLTEDTTMSTIYDIPLRLSEPQMDAFEILLLNLLESDLSDFTDGNDLLAMHAKKAVEEAINAMSIYGGVQ